MKILCFVSPWNIEQFTIIGRNMSTSAKIIYLSIYKALDETGLAGDYYKFLDAHGSSKLSSLEMNKIKRCRILRSLDEEKSRVHLSCITIVINKVLEEVRPDLVLSETVDSFFMDVIHTESVKRGIKFIGLVPSFVNGYFRITAKGEYNRLRKPAEKEVEMVLDLLERKEYLPNFIEPFSGEGLSFIAMRRWFRNLIRIFFYTVKRITSGERYNSNHWAGQVIGLTWFHFPAKFKIGDKNWRHVLKACQKPILYVPLQFTPEATVDYWCEDVSLIDYEKKISEFIHKLSLDFQVIVKEHPNFLGLRSPFFYKNLERLDGVIICPTGESSNELIRLSDAVLVYTGSVGFEAALRGKPVLCLSFVYYMIGPRFKVVNFSTSNNEILDFLRCVQPITLTEKKELVEHLLTGLLQGTFKNNWSWNKRNQKDVIDAVNIGKLLEEYYIENRA